ncbi:unnamed protein product [Calypogeia fissa]
MGMIYVKYVPVIVLVSLITVHSCVHFQAEYALVGDPFAPDVILISSLVDNGDSKCEIGGPSNPNGLYYYICQEGFGTTFDPSNGLVDYSNPWGEFKFYAQWINGPPFIYAGWLACNYDCPADACSTG